MVFSDSVRLINAWAVEWFCLKPNCLVLRRLFFSMKLYILSNINFSNNLLSIGKSDIGL